MNDILSDLYHGELRPNEHDYPADSDVSILLESFAQNEKWLGDLLGGKAKEYLLELVNIHDELIGTMTYDSFRDGFILGARLVMEVVSRGEKTSAAESRTGNRPALFLSYEGRAACR